jgi:hypothetical protein
MDSTSTPAAAGPADRRSAHRRVGAAAIVAFVALLLIGATRGPAQADSTVPAATPTGAPSQSAPDQRSDPAPGFRRDHHGPGGRDGGGGPGFGGGDGDRGRGFDGGGGDGGGSAPGGAAPAPAPASPAPSSGGSST